MLEIINVPLYIDVVKVCNCIINWTGGGGRNFRVMGSFQTGFGGGGGGGVGTAFPSAATFPHYAIQQGIPYNVYGYANHMHARALFMYIWKLGHVHCQLMHIQSYILLH